jgi:hypothetical protein
MNTESMIILGLTLSLRPYVGDRENLFQSISGYFILLSTYCFIQFITHEERS